MKIPNPGTKEAIDQGCKCPVMDNCYGKGYHWYPGKEIEQFIYSEECNLHTEIINRLRSEGNAEQGGV